jgi:hypothetical protein
MTTGPNELTESLAENRVVRLVEQDIYSALGDAAARHHYDSRAAVYDFVVGTGLYNSVIREKHGCRKTI